VIECVESEFDVQFFAIDGRWRAVFVEPPIAMSTVIAFSNASFVIISEGLMSFFTSSTTLFPVSYASFFLFSDIAKMWRSL